MKVICVDSQTNFPAVALRNVAPGRVVRYDDLEGVAEYYQVSKSTALEMPYLQIPPGKHLLMNLKTGRVVIKHGLLKVYLCSCTAEAYPTEK